MRPSLKAKLTCLTKLHINIPFAEAIATMPKYDKFLKEVISNKIILGEFELVELNEECSIIELKKFPSKLKELGSFTIPYTIMNSHFERDKTIAHPRGVIKNVLIKVDKFIFLVDVIILDTEDDKDVLIVLGQSFLNIRGTLIDVRQGKLTLRLMRRRFVKDFSKISKPMINLLAKDTEFEFSYACFKAFELLKEKLTSAPMVATFD
ncbi:hypothetical protein CR513_34487, partial [Mucuna pruriens]